jgi:hypothetical protein
MMARFDDVYLDSQYQNGSDGQLFKLELIYYPTTTINGSPEGLKRPQPDEVLGTDLQNLGNDKEAYRWTFLIENHLERDDYSRFIELCKAFSLPPATIDQGTRDLMDLSEWMRVFAIYSLAGVNDAYSQGNNHNLMFYVRPSDNRVLALPWDMDFSFNRPATSALWGDQNIAKIIALPSNQRVFHAHLRDLIDKAANPTYMTYWTSHYGSLAGQNYSSLLNYIGQRRSFVMSRLPQQVPFTISTNGGQDLTVNQDQAIIEGNAWYDVKDILLSGMDDPLDVTWTNVSRWRTVVKLEPGLNTLQFLALNLDGNLVGSDSINVTSAVGPQFIRGDPNLDRKVDVSDPVAVIFHLFLGVPVTCEDAADSNDDEALNLTDAIYLFDQLFQGGPTPPAPFPLQGVDPAGPELGCATGL